MKLSFLLTACVVFINVFAKYEKTYYYGKINNKYNIMMEVTNSNEDYIATYFYENSFQPIFLTGTFANELLTLQTVTNQSSDEKFVGSINANEFKGKWYYKNKNLVYTFDLKQCDYIEYVKEKYTGTYTILELSNEEKKELEIPLNENGVNGTCEIKQISATKIAFSLFYTDGFPRYHIGELSGFANYNKADNCFVYSDEEDVCTIQFKFQGNELIIEQKSTDIECGFGAFVDISNVYHFNSKTIHFNNWFK
ncbi:MAG: hypothetical protein H6553_13615 [Chitinophagales bacterium]|nr:hypothetical protein [Chitinophagales bacterium]